MSAVLAVIVLGMLGTPARADAAPLCRPSMDGPWEYQATLGRLVSGFVLAPPAPGSQPLPPPASTGIGAATLARQALGGQFSGSWLSTPVQGWAVGLAPGPLDRSAAHSAIVAAIAARYTADETAYLSERLHVDPQPYSEQELRTTQDALDAALRAEPGAAPAAVGIGCRLSDARRVEVEVYSPATPEQLQQINVLAEPYGDQVRVQLVPYGPPRPAVGPPIPLPPRPAAVVFGSHVKMPLLRRCVRGRHVRVAARASQPPVQALSVRVGGRSRMIAGRRLAKPLTVDLRGRRTRVAVTVWLADGRVGTKTVTYTRCR